MLKIETIEELESKVLKALELIGDLRTENGRLESENETLRADNDQMKLSMEEKEKELVSLKSQLQETSRELESLKSKEDQLEEKINSLIQKIEGYSVSTGSGQSTNRPLSNPQPVNSVAEKVKEPPISEEAPEEKEFTYASDDIDLAADTPFNDELEEVKVNASDISETNHAKDTPSEDDEIVLLDGDEELIEHEELELHIDDEELGESRTKADVASRDLSDDIIVEEDESINILDSEDDEDFLIIEDDEDHKARK